jgi:hypothetical protein
MELGYNGFSSRQECIKRVGTEGLNQAVAQVNKT